MDKVLPNLPKIVILNDCIYWQSCWSHPNPNCNPNHNPKPNPNPKEESF